MKSAPNYRFIGRALTVLTSVVFVGAMVSPRPSIASASSVVESQPPPKLDAEKAQALVKAYAGKKKIDFSQYENGIVRMERRDDGLIYWIVSYKRIVSKNEPIVPGSDALRFTVADETKEVRLLLGM